MFAGLRTGAVELVACSTCSNRKEGRERGLEASAGGGGSGGGGVKDDEWVRVSG